MPLFLCFPSTASKGIFFVYRSHWFLLFVNCHSQSLLFVNWTALFSSDLQKYLMLSGYLYMLQYFLPFCRFLIICGILLGGLKLLCSQIQFSLQSLSFSLISNLPYYYIIKLLPQLEFLFSKEGGKNRALPIIRQPTVLSITEKFLVPTFK